MNGNLHAPAQAEREARETFAGEPNSGGACTSQDIRSDVGIIVPLILVSKITVELVDRGIDCRDQSWGDRIRQAELAFLVRPAELNNRLFVEPISCRQTIGKTVLQLGLDERLLPFVLHFHGATHSIAEQRRQLENLGRRRESEREQKGELGSR